MYIDTVVWPQWGVSNGHSLTQLRTQKYPEAVLRI